MAQRSLLPVKTNTIRSWFTQTARTERILYGPKPTNSQT
jgi:hypothetical protein